MSDTRIVVHGGVNEIGGNKVLIEDGDTRVWLDFGMSFGQYQRYFEEFMGPRTATGLKDYLAMGLVPDLDGLYAPDLLAMLGRDHEDPAYDAVLISHAHDDHVKYVSFLDPDIPVWMSSTCLNIRRALEDTQAGTLENRIVRYAERDEEGRSTDDVVERNIQEFGEVEAFRVGDIEVEPYPVDHSIPGAFGFVLHTSAGAVVYTGDVRLHGRRGSQTERFVEAAREADPVAVLTEGTRIGDTEKVGESEEGVHDTVRDEATATQGLVLVDYSFKDADRLRTLLKVAKATGRRLAVGTRAAALYREYAADPAVSIDDVGDLLVHVKQKTRYNVWEREVMDRHEVVTSEELAGMRSEVILGLNQWTLTELIDIEPRNALYVRSISEPYNEEMELDEQRLDNWLDHYHMRKTRAHCSGHAPGADLERIVQRIDADTIVPIHTEHPEAFSKLGRVREPTLGEAVEL